MTMSLRGGGDKGEICCGMYADILPAVAPEHGPLMQLIDALVSHVSNAASVVAERWMKKVEHINLGEWSGCLMVVQGTSAEGLEL